MFTPENSARRPVGATPVVQKVGEAARQQRGSEIAGGVEAGPEATALLLARKIKAMPNARPKLTQDVVAVGIEANHVLPADHSIPTGKRHRKERHASNTSLIQHERLRDEHREEQDDEDGHDDSSLPVRVTSRCHDEQDQEPAQRD
jgi:hypothetical protein